jgi:chromosome segregation ATPase
MASLADLVKSSGNRKTEISKLLRQIENKLKEVSSQKRGSLSRLSSIERTKENLARKKYHALQILNQHMAQRDSIERLRIVAGERLLQEQDAKDQLKQQSEFGGPEEKVQSLERLKYTDEKISDLKAGLKEREALQTKLVKDIEFNGREIAKIDQQLKKHAQAKPTLLLQVKTSATEETSLRPRLESLVKLESQASKRLETLKQKLVQITSQKKMTRPKSRTRPKKAKRKHVNRKAKTRTKTQRTKIPKRKAKSPAKKIIRKK